MEALPQLVSRPGSLRSISVTDQPRCWRCSAALTPIMPPPRTITLCIELTSQIKTARFGRAVSTVLFALFAAAEAARPPAGTTRCGRRFACRCGRGLRSRCGRGNRLGRLSNRCRFTLAARQEAHLFPNRRTASCSLVVGVLFVRGSGSRLRLGRCLDLCLGARLWLGDLWLRGVLGLRDRRRSLAAKTVEIGDCVSRFRPRIGRERVADGAGETFLTRAATAASATATTPATAIGAALLLAAGCLLLAFLTVRLGLRILFAFAGCQ